MNVFTSFYGVSMPDMSRNMALAGKTVSSGGMNVTYNDKGYAVQSVNYKHPVFKGSENAVRAPSIDAVLASGDRGHSATAADLAHFSDEELEQLERRRDQVRRGELSAQQAYTYLEEMRSSYGYHGDGFNEFAALEPVKLPNTSSVPDASSQIAMTMMTPRTETETASAAAAPAAESASAAAAVPAVESAPAAAATPAVETASAAAAVPAAQTAPAAQASPSTPAVQTAPNVVTERAVETAPNVVTELPASTRAVEPTFAQGGTEQLREDYQKQLKNQQNYKTYLGADVLKAYGEQKKNELFDVLFEQDEEKDD
ncbi:MAG: hypothetical protein E7425_05730 [Ruminococcaceae bacterium]|nr:hypothetical protein [Oscillospiraceae bacterium]